MGLSDEFEAIQRKEFIKNKKIAEKDKKGGDAKEMRRAQQRLSSESMAARKSFLGLPLSTRVGTTRYSP